MLKTFFVLELFAFLSRLFGYVEKRLDKKAKVCFKIYDLTDRTTNNCNTKIGQYCKTGLQIVIIHKLPNTTRSKDNQTVKFGQLRKHHVRTRFRRKSYRNQVR